MRARATKQLPCPTCGHPDWCLVGDDSCICMRMFSEEVYTFKDGSVGYIHRFEESRPRTPMPVRRPTKSVEIDAEAMIERWLSTTKPQQIRLLAEGIGVKASALLELHVSWSNEHQAWAWPMRDGNGKVVGIRLRNQIGQKWAIKGSKQGLFLPWTNPAFEAYIVEGPTDTAAGLSLGLFTVGRPNCSGGLYDLKVALQRLKVRHVVIIADNDQDKVNGDRVWNPGIDGANMLSRNLCIPCCTLVLPTKDLREFVKCGGAADQIEKLSKTCVWTA